MNRFIEVYLFLIKKSKLIKVQFQIFLTETVQKKVSGNQSGIERLFNIKKLSFRQVQTPPSSSGQTDANTRKAQGLNRG